MIKDVKSVIARNRNTLLEDAAGAAALVVILAVALYLPGMV